MEDSLVRAETAKKDNDLIAVLRICYAIAKDGMKRTEGEKDNGK